MIRRGFSSIIVVIIVGRDAAGLDLGEHARRVVGEDDLALADPVLVLRLGPAVEPVAHRVAAARLVEDPAQEQQLGQAGRGRGRGGRLDGDLPLDDLRDDLLDRLLDDLGDDPLDDLRLGGRSGWRRRRPAARPRPAPISPEERAATDAGLCPG